MNYIDPRQITADRLSVGSKHVYVQPREEYEIPALTGQIGDQAVIVLMGAKGGYVALPRSECREFGGVLVPDPLVQVDLSSAFDPRSRTSTGSIVRQGYELALACVSKHYVSRQVLVTVEDKLPYTEESVAFYRWRLVIKEDDTYVELFSADHSPSTSI